MAAYWTEGIFIGLDLEMADCQRQWRCDLG